MTTYVALLRAINLGPKNKVPMAELTKIFAAARCSDVRTYIQSGNVVFCASPTIASALRGDLQRRIRKQFDLEVPVVLRTVDEMKAVLRENPYAKRSGMENSTGVMFLADLPAPERVKSLDPKRSPGEEYVVKGREIYLWLPNGFGRSKLSNAYFDSKLTTVSTARNWRTVLKLTEMAISI